MGKTYIILPIAHPANRLGGFKLRFGGMNIEKAIALFLALVLAVYSYTAFFEMDYLLPPILQRNPVWPSTFPKILSEMGVIACALVFLNIEKSEKQVGDDLDISAICCGALAASAVTCVQIMEFGTGVRIVDL